VLTSRLWSAASKASRRHEAGLCPARAVAVQRREAEKEGFEPSKEDDFPLNALAGRRLQPLGHFSAARPGYPAAQLVVYSRDQVFAVDDLDLDPAQTHVVARVARIH